MCHASSSDFVNEAIGNTDDFALNASECVYDDDVLSCWILALLLLMFYWKFRPPADLCKKKFILVFEYFQVVACHTQTSDPNIIIINIAMNKSAFQIPAKAP